MDGAVGIGKNFRPRVTDYGNIKESYSYPFHFQTWEMEHQSLLWLKSKLFTLKKVKVCGGDAMKLTPLVYHGINCFGQFWTFMIIAKTPFRRLDIDLNVLLILLFANITQVASFTLA